MGRSRNTERNEATEGSSSSRFHIPAQSLLMRSMSTRNWSLLATLNRLQNISIHEGLHSKTGPASRLHRPAFDDSPARARGDRYPAIFSGCASYRSQYDHRAGAQWLDRADSGKSAVYPRSGAAGKVAASRMSRRCPWRIDLLSNSGGNRAGQLRRATVAECIR
jgi:hypothetical protein